MKREWKFKGHYLSKNKPEVLTYNGNPKKSLTGFRKGNLTVLGLYRKSMPNKTNCWVLKCDCGYYTSRFTAAIVMPYNGDNECHVCKAKNKQQ